ncbi:MAG: gliding motility-associated protein GldE [Ignavibacterium album]|uniref:hemolysin family protein n=1 Tax=Ignavibacterium album TaxID=591197 RepID=UPI0026F37B87|nr:gliding motility-associated protein GldE [Ignavibacterium album]MCX8105367.1 gliding motility-associated protein GldE [Ignavibacterium album]
MEADRLVNFLSFFVLLFFSGFFSGSEVSFFSLDKKKIDRHFKNNPLIHRYLITLINFPRRLLVTILIGNTFVNVAISIVAVLIAIDIAKLFQLNINIIISIQILLTTIFVLIFGELIPKVIATKSTIQFAKFAAVPIYLISAVLYPISEFITEIIRLTVSKFKFDKSKSALTAEEFSELADLSTETGAIDENEKEIINSIVEFRETTVAEIMTPRVDIIAVPENKSIDDVIKIISESGHSRIPVYRDSIDLISGVVLAKDLLRFINDDQRKRQTKISSLLKKVLFVPESKKIGDLLREFQSKKIHLAIVVDEYGGTSGLITLEDIIEEVVGDIWDEYDRAEKNIQLISENKFLVDGNILLEDLSSELGINLIDENDPDIDTLAGFILKITGEIPKEGHSFVYNEYRITVKQLDKKRIRKVIIEKTVTK